MEDWLAAQRRSRPGGLALTFQGQAWTYAQLDDAVEDWCGRLSGAGFQRGEVVAVHLANSPAFVGLIHAFARLGLVLAPLNLRLAEVELAWQAEQLGARWLISDTLEAGRLREAASQAGFSGAPYQVLGLAALRAQPRQDFSPVPVELDAVQAIVFTSGTSGKPKGAVLTFGSHFWSALGSAARLGVLPGDLWLSGLALYHVGGLAVVFRSCLYGTAICLHAGFNLEAVAHSLEQEPVTLISVVPTMLQRLLAAGARFPATLRLVLLGGASATPDLLQACWDRGLPVAPSYGLTETASQVVTMAPDEAHRKPGCVGKPLLFTHLRIVDEAGSDLPVGEVGEICLSGPTLMREYWRNEAATRQSLPSGELHTGDLGYLDTDGDLWVLQRRSDLILSGGENVYPAEVEAVLRQHPAVAEVCVVGVPDKDWGQRVAAMVVLRAGQPVSEADLDAFARQRLAGYKCPRLLRFVEALPQTASGKIARAAVAELLTLPHC